MFAHDSYAVQGQGDSSHSHAHNENVGEPESELDLKGLFLTALERIEEGDDDDFHSFGVSHAFAAEE